MTSDSSALRTRRAVLVGAFGGFAAVVGHAIARPASSLAGTPYGNGDNVVIGRDHTNASTLTYINNPNNANTVFGVQSTKGGIALHGRTNTGDATVGFVDGTGNGVHGIGNANTGVGVRGDTATGRGVHGSSSGTGTGVYGLSVTGIGVLASSSSGEALSVDGRTSFFRSGIATIGIGKRSIAGAIPWDVTTDTQVFATLDTNQAGLLLQSITKNVADNKLKITLNANVISGKYAKVAWVMF